MEPKFNYFSPITILYDPYTNSFTKILDMAPLCTPYKELSIVYLTDKARLTRFNPVVHCLCATKFFRNSANSTFQ